MAFSLYNSLLLLFISFNFISHSTQTRPPLSLSFPLTTYPLSHNSTAKKLLTSLISSKSPSSPPYNYRSSFKYSMALIVSLPIGTPPQTQQMVLDTGSQLSWIQCHKKPPKRSPPTTSFDPSLSSSYSVLPCTHPLCKPRIPDYTLPTSCDQNRFCHYSYFYADGTYAEGNLVMEKFTFSPSRITPPLILGCALDSADAEGILGMNFGKFSFASQYKLQQFSYCVPLRQKQLKTAPRGGFYLGKNPNSNTFKYVDVLRFTPSQSQRMPNLDPLAYTVGMTGIRIGGKRLNISTSAFRPDAGGSGQTIVDSGTEYTFLVPEAYVKVREEIVRLVGPRRVKKGYVYGGSLDLCFDGDAVQIGRLIGDVAFLFEKGVEVVINKDRVLDDVGGGVYCFGIGRSDLLGIPSNIIGNFHQQNLWVEFDLANRRVGFGRADCSRSV